MKSPAIVVAGERVSVLLDVPDGAESIEIPDAPTLVRRTVCIPVDFFVAAPDAHRLPREAVLREVVRLWLEIHA